MGKDSKSLGSVKGRVKMDLSEDDEAEGGF